MEQKDINTDPKMIRSALSFMQGEAATWAAPHIEEAMKALTSPANEALFGGVWATFKETFKAHFGSLDEQADAQKKLEGFVQGKQTVVKAS
ncbi:hypothetical protein D9758_013823 [Tetrapyrgos nigripes]|uniref:Retrotransposon gag domain-containing protein n=1 Tax=Tetrapyrgos nigripes TaxID=182062 RepID=A0A8H5CTW5_9AGAR|nr:hypothetical protein D9758_013823 [Tetrapyrgos nigripes]